MYPQWTELGADVRAIDWASQINEKEAYFLWLLTNNIITAEQHIEFYKSMIETVLADEIKVDRRPIVIHDDRKKTAPDVLYLRACLLVNFRRTISFFGRTKFGGIRLYFAA